MASKRAQKQDGKDEQDDAPFPKDQHNDGDPDQGFVDPSRPDQVQLAGDRPEIIDIKVIDEGEAREGVDDRNDERTSDEEDAQDARRTARQTREAREEEGEEESQSERVRRRINRERALRRKSELKSEELARENRELRERLKIERVADTKVHEANLKALSTQIEAVKKDLEKAIEAGETKDQLELNIKLGELLADKKLLERDIATAKAQREHQEEDPGQREEGKIDPRAQEAASEWAKQNRHWWGKPEFRRHRDMTAALDRELLAQIREGEVDFEPYSDEHMTELARRVQAMYPNLEVYDTTGELADTDEEDPMRDDEYEDAPRRKSGRDREARRGAPQGGMGGRGTRRRPGPEELARQGKVVLTREDNATMRLFKLDPNDPKVRKRFAQERMRTILNGARR